MVYTKMPQKALANSNYTSGGAYFTFTLLKTKFAVQAADA